MVPELPIIYNRFVCIADVNKPELTAIISSYLSLKNHYLPIFEFPNVTSENYERDGDIVDENTLSKIRASQFATFVNNVLARIGSCEYLILAGLSKNQKSYLDFIGMMNVIEITEIAEIDFYLSLFHEGGNKIIQCNPEDFLTGLFIALKENSILQIDNAAEHLELQIPTQNGIIIIENDYSVATVIAINYAFSINADIYIVNKLEEDERLMIQNYIEEWQNGNLAEYTHIENIVNDRIGNLQLNRFQFATFFTTGIPYSLIIKNSIPCSYVNIEIRPDFFIINNLIYAGKNQLGGGVVFSPQFFKDEETKLISKIINENNYFVKDIFGKEASVYNLNMNLKEFPYDIFHICSHGGEIEGRTLEESFTDRNGNHHVVEYDEALSFSPSSSKGLLHVQRKTFFLKFNGYTWRSPELKNQNYPHYIFVDMENAMRVSNADQKKVISKRKRVSNSCAIQCSDSTYQCMLTTIASHSSPLIFNNTCSSWNQIAEAFLMSGARGYIGTLWDVKNSVAIEFAVEFYNNVFSNRIIDSFHKAMKTTIGTDSENIYIFWGLHFSFFEKQSSIAESRSNIFKQILRSYYLWKDRLSFTQRKTTSELITELINWTVCELKTNFTKSDFDLLKEDIQIKNKK